MPLQLIIDGYNFIRQSSSLSPLDARNLERGREALLGRLAAYRKIRGHPITVVFDGWGGFSPMSTEQSRQGIQVVYTGKGETADEWIKRRVTKIQYGAVVTSDVEIQRHAERSGVTAIASPVFEQKLEAAISGAMQETDRDDEDEREEEELIEAKKKGPAWRLSKQERRRQAILKKL